MHPAKQESPGGAEAAAQVGVLSSGFWNRSAELGKGERAKEREDSADNPSGKNDGDAAPFARHLRGLEEDACADHGANHDGRRSPSSQPANQFRPLFAHAPSVGDEL